MLLGNVINQIIATKQEKNQQKQMKVTEDITPEHTPTQEYRRRAYNTFNDIERLVESRREAYLEITFRSRKLFALLDSGCQKSVIGRNLIPKDYLKPTKHKLNVANGAPLPILGETVLEFEVAGFKTGVHVVVSNAVTDLILGIE